MAQQSNVEILRRIPFFADLPDDEPERLQSKLEVVHLKSGEILYREGETARPCGRAAARRPFRPVGLSGRHDKRKE